MRKRSSVDKNADNGAMAVTLEQVKMITYVGATLCLILVLYTQYSHNYRQKGDADRKHLWLDTTAASDSQSTNYWHPLCLWLSAWRFISASWVAATHET